MTHRSWILYPGCLCRVGGILNNPKKIKGIGIIIKEAQIDLGYGFDSDEWFVLVGGNIEKINVGILWPINAE